MPIKKYLLCALTLYLLSCSSSRTANNVPVLQGIPLELTTNFGEQQQFVEGEEIQFLLSLGSDAYVYMYHINANNELTQLLPSKHQPSNYYISGYFLTIPEYENGYGYRFTIKKPFGESFIWVVASDQLININVDYHSITDVKKKIKQGSNQAYGEYVFKITTQKK